MNPIFPTSLLPTRCRRVLPATMIFMIMSLSGGAWALDGPPDELDWEALIPEGWNPAAPFERYTEVEIEQMSAEEISLLEAESQMIFDEAPAVDSLDGRQVRMPGYLLPLEFNEEQVSEFLLVPYLGACIHTPPPPANQIVYGRYEPGYAVDDLYTPVWISGRLRVERESSELGETGFQETLEVNSGYSMQVEMIEPYLE